MPSSPASTSVATPPSASSSPAAPSPALGRAPFTGFPPSPSPSTSPPEHFAALHAAGLKPDPALRQTLAIAAARAAQLVRSLVAATPPQSFIVHNANFPAGCAADAPVHRTVPARVIVPGLFSPAADDGTHRFIFKYGHNVSPVAPLTDCDTIERGLISHTVLDYTKLGGF